MRPDAGSPSTPMFPPNTAKVTPSDSAVFPFPCAIRVGSAGKICVRPASGEDAVTITAMAIGEYVGCTVIGVNSTGTDVTDITRYW